MTTFFRSGCEALYVRLVTLLERGRHALVVKTVAFLRFDDAPAGRVMAPFPEKRVPERYVVDLAGLHATLILRARSRAGRAAQNAVEATAKSPWRRRRRATTSGDPYGAATWCGWRTDGPPPRFYGARDERGRGGSCSDSYEMSSVLLARASFDRTLQLLTSYWERTPGHGRAAVAARGGVRPL